MRLGRLSIRGQSYTESEILNSKSEILNKLKIQYYNALSGLKHLNLEIKICLEFRN